MYDILFKNISVIDGTGAPAYVGNVAVKNGKIIMNPSEDAKEIVDGTGLSICPGFIDAHSHGDTYLGTDVSRVGKANQGITTEICGQCGSSQFPVSLVPDRFAASLDKAKSGREEALDITRFTNAEGYFQWANEQHITCNFCQFVGHSALRFATMGLANRKATPEELEEMKAYLRDGMEHGAMGMSSGLIYAPSCYAEEDELVELCKVVAEYGGIYATHMRNEAGDVEKSVRESISVAEKAGCRLEISHHKICGKDNWGKSKETLRLIREARERGVPIMIDVYPYTASMTSLRVCLPAHFLSIGPEQVMIQLRDPEVRKALREEMEVSDNRFRQCGGGSGILIATAPNTPDAEGATLDVYAKNNNIDSYDALFDILAANGGLAQAIYFSMDDADLERIVCDEYVCIGTDGIARNLRQPTHPRAIASFPKAIRHFVKEKKLMSLEEMVRKMTSLPAAWFHLDNKGIIADGYDADLLIFNADTIQDRATYTDSLALCDGIERVLVGGVTVYQDKAMTGLPAGKYIPYRK